jgi:hypothetical protein
MKDELNYIQSLYTILLHFFHVMNLSYLYIEVIREKCMFDVNYFLEFACPCGSC